MEYCYKLKWKTKRRILQHGSDKKIGFKLQNISEKFGEILGKLKREKKPAAIKKSNGKTDKEKKTEEDEENKSVLSGCLLDGEIELPFHKEDVECISEKKIIQYISRKKLHLAKEHHVSKEQIHFLTTDKYLKAICKETADSGWLLRVLLFEDILEKVQLKYGIDISKIKVGMLDSENGITEYLLKMLVKQSNFLTIFTKREKSFEKIQENIYMEEGLLIEVAEPERGQLEQVDVLIDIYKQGYQYYKYLKKEAMIMALSANVENIEKVIAKSGKRTIIYDINADIPYISGREETQVFMEALYWKNWKAAYMIEHFMKDIEPEEGEALCREYGITLKGIKCIVGQDIEGSSCFGCFENKTSRKNANIDRWETIGYNTKNVK